MRVAGAVLAVAATSLVFATAATAQFPHVNSYENGTIVPSPWQGMYESVPGRMSVTASPTDPLHNVMRAELRGGDVAVDPWDGKPRSRAEAWDRRGSPVNDYSTWPDGQGSERWYGWRTYLEPGFPSPPPPEWTVITQWQDWNVPGEPPFSLVVDSGKFELQSAFRGFTWAGQATEGQWHTFLFHVRWSPSSLIGFVELWHNGTLVVPRTAMATMAWDKTQLPYRPSPVYLRQGMYRSTTIPDTAVLYHDTVRIGETRAQVEP